MGRRVTVDVESSAHREASSEPRTTTGMTRVTIKSFAPSDIHIMATLGDAWDAALDEEVARMDAGNPADDGFLMAGGLKNASKCRECAKTLDVGTPAWCVLSTTLHASFSFPIDVASRVCGRLWPQVSQGWRARP